MLLYRIRNITYCRLRLIPSTRLRRMFKMLVQYGSCLELCDTEYIVSLRLDADAVFQIFDLDKDGLINKVGFATFTCSL